MASRRGWVSSGLETYDYGAIKLNCTIGTTTGWYGFFWQSASLTGLPDDTRGYPGDKPSGTQWLANNCATWTRTPDRSSRRRKRNTWFPM